VKRVPFGSTLALAFSLLPIAVVAADRPEKFEPYLREHPDDESKREDALVWYARETHDFERLREHTLRMIDHHPSNMHIYFENSTEFLSRPSYHAEVLGRLEGRVKAISSGGAYWVLALMCELRAIPPDLSTEAAKRRFLDYNGLKSDATLPKHVDQELVAKTIRYFKQAIELATKEESVHSKDAELADSDRWHQNFYARQLVDFYISLNRNADALALCKTLAMRKENLSDASFLVTYGQSLFAAGQFDDAKRWLVQVRLNDHEGFEKGPAHCTTAAESALGLIELERGDIRNAVEHLDASTKVQKCCHNTTKGFPTELATKLLEKGEAVPVIRYCETVLRDFTPDCAYLKTLMEKAKAARRASTK